MVGQLKDWKRDESRALRHGDAEKTLSEDKSGQVLAVSVRLVNEGRIGIP